MDPIKILIADDNSAIRATLSEGILAQPDMELLGQAADGAEALCLIDRLHPDVLLLDIVMPRTDGFGVLEALQQRENAPQVIVITGLTRDEFIDRAMGLGAAYYMIKPIDMDCLCSRIRDICHVPAAGASPKRRPQPAMSDDEAMANLFLTIGIPAHIKGYQYLREAVRMVSEDRTLLSRITKELYPGIARRFSTSASKVERAMRHAIEVAWTRGRLDAANQMYGYKVFQKDDKPTNGEFISCVAEKISMAKTA